jgi:hypothetical protein
LVKNISTLKVMGKYIFRPSCIKSCLCLSMLLGLYGIEHKFCFGTLETNVNSGHSAGPGSQSCMRFHSWIEINNTNISDPPATALACRMLHSLS